jgi:hypothetical protein
MPQRPPRDPKPASRTSPLEQAAGDILRIGKHYADEFAKLVKLAATFQYLQTSNLDSAPVLAQLPTIAEEAGANLELELDQVRAFCAELLPQIEVCAVAHDEIESCALAPSTTTLHSLP